MHSHKLAFLALIFIVCTCVGQITPPTTAAPTAAELLTRWSHAVGDPGAKDQPTSVSLKATTSEAGMDGSEKILLNANGYRKLTEQHGDHMEEVRLDKVCWLKDWNGHVRQLEGRDLKGEITDAFLQGLLFRSRKLGVATAEYAGEDETRKFQILKMTIPGGVPLTVYLDRTTGLPARAVRKEYDDDLTLEFKDWHKVGTSTFPFCLKRTGGEDRSEKTIAIKSVTNTLKPVSISRPTPVKDYRFAQGSSALGIPFLLEEAADHIMVEVSINGTAETWFLVDTGADITVINKDRMAQFGLTGFGSSFASGGGNAAEYSQTKVASQKIGGVELLNQRVGVMSLKGLERLYGMPIGGLIGYDFLSRFVVEVNYDTRKINLIEPSQFAYRGKGDQIKFVMEEGHPHVPGRSVCRGVRRFRRTS